LTTLVKICTLILTIYIVAYRNFPGTYRLFPKAHVQKLRFNVKHLYTAFFKSCAINDSNLSL